MKTIAFFNNKGGVGKTSLVYHLAWMFAKKGLSVLAVDFDPQANLTAMFVPDDDLEALWPDDDSARRTVYGAVRPIMRGLGDVAAPEIVNVRDALSLIPGDLALASFEDKLSAAWPACHNRDEAAFRTMTAFHRLMLAGGGDNVDIVLIDVGPNLGAINRAALIAADHVCIPLGPDLFSQQGLRNLGPTLRQWRETWRELKGKAPKDLALPAGAMAPIGYVVMQHSVREARPVKAYQKWIDRIPEIYRRSVLDEQPRTIPKVDQDPFALATLKHYRSLMPMAMESRKPMFELKPADGAIGSHVDAVRSCGEDFAALARKIASRVGLALGPDDDVTRGGL